MVQFGEGLREEGEEPTKIPAGDKRSLCIVFFCFGWGVNQKMETNPLFQTRSLGREGGELFSRKRTWK